MPTALRAKTKTIYSPMGGHISKKDADIFGRRMDWLLRTGELTPTRIVEDAKNPASPLHKYFEWNDRQAAIRYRISQARKLMGSIAIQIVGPKGEILETRAFHNIIIPVYEGGREMKVRVYKASQEVFSTSFMKDQVVQQALAMLESWQDKYGRYQSLSAASFLIRRAISSLKVGKKK